MRFALPLAVLALAAPAFSQSESTPDERVEPQAPGVLELEDTRPEADRIAEALGVQLQRSGEGRLGNAATIAIPEGYVFGDGEAARKFMEASRNFPSGAEVGLIATESLNPWTVFEFEEIGYVEDDEKDELDADALMEGFRSGNAAANEERAKRGWDTLEIVGWRLPPRYNPQTNNLEWAIEVGNASGASSVNHEVRLLGRKGVMKATLVCSSEEYSGLLPDFEQLLGGFAYVSGERYSEYTSGDKIAAYGLTALVAGGAGVLAVKTGFLAKFWKFIAAGVIGLGALVKKLFGGGKTESGSSSS